jgi:hypothetical protein
MAATLLARNFKKNSGFILVLPNHFATENFPGSMMTQVIGITNNGKTVGFYVDQNTISHGFTHLGTVYTKVDYPTGSKFNQLIYVHTSCPRRRQA